MKPEETALEALKSQGVSILNAPEKGDRDGGATIIVVGVPRSGTSMVAASLRTLGVFIGERADTAVHEDVDIARAIETGNERELKSLIAARDKAHSLWGFKRPTAYASIGRFLPLFRNPRFVVVFRDVAAIAKRNEISMHMDFLTELQLASERNMQLVAFVTKLQYPAMVVSYEKALSHPRHYLTSLCDFCGIEADRVSIKRALTSIENGPARYLNSSRLRFEGRIESVEDGIAIGWARRVGQNAPLVVVVRSGGEEIGRGSADIYRPDLEAQKKEGGRCAFRIRLSDRNASLQSVEAFVEKTKFKLPTTPVFEKRD